MYIATIYRSGQLETSTSLSVHFLMDVQPAAAPQRNAAVARGPLIT